MKQTILILFTIVLVCSCKERDGIKEDAKTISAYKELGNFLIDYGKAVNEEVKRLDSAKKVNPELRVIKPKKH